MEDLATWNDVERCIAEAVDEHEQDLATGLSGVSLIRRIYQKLLDAGYIKKPVDIDPKDLRMPWPQQEPGVDEDGLAPFAV